MAINKGFIKDWLGNTVLPITRGELVLDIDGNVALNSQHFLAGENGNAYGLITAAERAMLSGGEGNTGGIADIYTKLESINTGLKFNNSVLNFYNPSTGAATPITFTSTGDGAITIATNSNNIVNLSLTEVPNAETTVTQILKGISVDKYGRITSVTSAALTNADIPAELSGKTLKTSILDGCTTSDKEIGTDEKSVANKAYVDAKVAEVTGVATGALKFGGTVNSADIANGYLNLQDYWNSYFKVTGEFKLNTGDFYDTAGISTNNSQITVKIGDTLIVYPPSATSNRAQFIYIPSGDDTTTITIRKESNDILTSANDHIIIKFSDIFSVINSPVGSNIAYISLPQAASNQSGYLSATDYSKFNSYADNLKVSYSGEFTSGDGIYKIGTLTVGTTDSVIYGKYNISNLSLTNGASDVYNPILKFTETGATDVNITLKGVNGISVKKNGNNVEFGAANSVISDSEKYLKIDSGYQFGVKVGTVENPEGLTDYAEFSNFRANVLSTTVVFDLITNSLKDTSKTYYYGSTALAEAVEITI